MCSVATRTPIDTFLLTPMNDLELKREALRQLKTFYGYDSFYPLQWEIISHVMHGGDAVVLMPTGGGKSLCYQLPALLSDGCTIVVSPLLALMKDQVDALMTNGIPAAAINSQQTDQQNRDIVEHVYAGHIKLLYISPEKLLSELNLWASNMRVSLIAIDEAHCISQWGHDFRPEYTQLAVLKERFPAVPIMALTATADRLTRQDIARQLNIEQAKVFITSFDRPNIRLNVLSNVTGRQKLRTIIQFIDRHRGESGIVYCLSRKSTESLAEKLRAAGINAEAFHASMATQRKTDVQQRFLNDDLQVVVATIAFGMGINKSNVRWVIHANMPKNLECYYQEIGRAGRDGLPAEALMFYSFSDVVTLTSFAQDSGQSQLNKDKLRRMQQYAESGICRRRILLSYFNENYDHDCHNCDVCSNPPERIDGTRLAQMAMSAIVRTGQHVGVNMITDILRGVRNAELTAAGYDRLPTFGVGRDLSYAHWNAYMLQMLQMGLIDVAYEENRHLRVTDYGREVLRGHATVEFTKFTFESLRRRKKQPQQAPAVVEKTPDEALFETLRLTRLALDRAAGIPPYQIFSDKVLRIMAQERPVNQAQFSVLYGVGEYKAAKYWRPFTAAIARYLSTHP